MLTSIERRERAFLHLAWANFAVLIFVFVLLVFLDYQGRQRGWEDDLRGCRISQSARNENVGRELDIRGTAADLQEFALRAAYARRASGETAVAKSYRRIARRAVQRADKAQARLERARERKRTTPCAVLYPKPSLSPLGGLRAHW